MRNFNTNQTRHFYVAGAVDANVDTNLDIALGTTATGEMYFKYKNADGLLTRSDTIDPKKVVSLKNTAASAMATKLMMHTITVDTNAVTLSSLVGKSISITVTTLGLIDYDASNGISITATITGDSTNTGSASNLYKAIAMALAKAMPKFDPEYPLFKIFIGTTEVTKDTTTVSGTAASIKLVEAPQKYVRGKLSGEPVPFMVSTKAELSEYDVVAWGSEAVAVSDVTGNLVVPANYVLADLEYFAYGERGDYFRGSNWPNDYTPTYAIDPKSATAYNVVTIEYYWAGNVENVQKSPRIIQIAASEANATSLYNSISALVDPTAALASRVTALEH